jgi:flagellar motor switch protein FliG
MTEIEKVAVLLIALGPDRSQRILDRLGPDELLPIVQAMRAMKKIPPEIRESVLLEVNGILEDLAATSFPGSDFDPDAPPSAQETPPELPIQPSAKEILGQVQDELPESIASEDLPEIDWGAAGFDFGSGKRGKKDEDDPPPDGGRGR